MRLRRAGRAALVAVVVLVASSCGISLQSLPKIGGVSGPTYKVTATFTNVVNLPIDAEVRVGAFAVGDVASIGLEGFQAFVTMRIKDSTKLPQGTTASIRFDTPLGEDFVLLQPPAVGTTTAAYLTNGSTIPVQDTDNAPSVEDTFGALGALLNGGGINQLQTIISQTDLALNPNRAQIRALINDLNASITSLSHNTPAIDNALAAMAALSSTLDQGRTTIAQGIAALGPAVGVLASQTGQFQKLFANLDTLSSAANQIVDQSASGTVDTVRELQPLLDQLTSVQSQLGPALSAVTALEEYTPPAVPGHYLQLAINATIGIPPVPSDAPPLSKITVDPPDGNGSYDSQSSIAMLMEGGLP